MSRPQGWLSFRNSRLLNVTACRHLAGNARFTPLAEMLTTQPCQGVAEKVSLVPWARSGLEGAGQGGHTQYPNGISPGNGEVWGAQQLMTESMSKLRPLRAQRKPHYDNGRLRVGLRCGPQGGRKAPQGAACRALDAAYRARNGLRPPDIQ